jgi:hypothetical protein
MQSDIEQGTGKEPKENRAQTREEPSHFQAPQKKVTDTNRHKKSLPHPLIRGRHNSTGGLNILSPIFKQNQPIPRKCTYDQERKESTASVSK